MEDGNVPKDFISYQDSIHRQEQLLRETLRKEREDIIREKMKNEMLTRKVQRTIETLKDELTFVDNKVVELENETEQLQEVSESEMQNKLIITNDFENIKGITNMFDAQIVQLKNTLEEFDVKTNTINEQSLKTSAEINLILKNRKIKEQTFEKEINVWKTLIEVEIKNNDAVLKEKTLRLNKLRSESEKLDETLEEQQKILKEKQDYELQEKNRINEKKVEEQTVLDELRKAEEKIAEVGIKNKEENDKDKELIKTLEDQISLEIEEDKKKEDILKELRENHNKLDEEIAKIEEEINKIEDQNAENQEILTEKQTLVEELTSKLASEKKENLLNQESFEKNMNIAKEKLEEFQKMFEEHLQQIEIEKVNIESLEKQIQIAEASKTQELMNLENLKKKIEEKSLNHEKQIIEFEDKIRKIQKSHEEKSSTNENLTTSIEKLEKQISEKENLETSLQKKISQLEKITLNFQKCKQDFEASKQEQETVKSELEKVLKTPEKGLPKKKQDRINKLEKEIEIYEHEMNALLKSEIENHKKEKKLVEDSVKESLDKIQELKTLKTNLEEQLGQILKETVDFAQKIEAKNKEKTFKFPNAPIKTKPAIISDDEFKKSFPLTQKLEKSQKKSVVNLWPTDNETTDSSHKNKKPVGMSALLGIDQKSQKFWPTDTETSDDGLKKRNPLTQNFPLTQKQTNISRPDEDLFECQTQKKPDSSQYSSSQKSEKKIFPLTQKSEKGIIEIDSRSDDDMFLTQKNHQSKKSDQKSKVFTQRESNSDDDMFETEKPEHFQSQKSEKKTKSEKCIERDSYSDEDMFDTEIPEPLQTQKSEKKNKTNFSEAKKLEKYFPLTQKSEKKSFTERDSYSDEDMFPSQKSEKKMKTDLSEVKKPETNFTLRQKSEKKNYTERDSYSDEEMFDTKKPEPFQTQKSEKKTKTDLSEAKKPEKIFTLTQKSERKGFTERDSYSDEDMFDTEIPEPLPTQKSEKKIKSDFLEVKKGQKNVPLTQKSEKRGFTERDSSEEYQKSEKKIKTDFAESKKVEKNTQKSQKRDFTEKKSHLNEDELFQPAKKTTQKSEKKFSLTQKPEKIPEKNHLPDDFSEFSKKLSQLKVPDTQKSEMGNIFDSLKNNTHKEFDATARKKITIDFFSTENDSSDNSFYEKMQKSKKIQNKLKPDPKKVNFLDTSISE